MYKIIHLPTAMLVRYCGTVKGSDYFPLFETDSLVAATKSLNDATFFESLKGTEYKILYIYTGATPIYMETIPKHHLEIIEVPDV